MEEATTGFCPTSWSTSPASASAEPPSGFKSRHSLMIFSMSVARWFGTFAASSSQSRVPSSYLRPPGLQPGSSAQPPPPCPKPCDSPYAKTFFRNRDHSEVPTPRSVTNLSPSSICRGTVRAHRIVKYLCCVNRSKVDRKTSRNAGQASPFSSISLCCTGEALNERPGCFRQCSRNSPSSSSISGSGAAWRQISAARNSAARSRPSAGSCP
mmetsp:Transcript_69440/g.194736  ORF Transcript_69440/g.194736 Transcript_69440/m.194736 type:complete len:211 (+) Transcript_69440:805-1437(+)